MKAKSKLRLIKIISFIAVPIFFFLVSALYVLIGVSELWGDMFSEGITTSFQWFTLIAYRFLIYVFPPLILAFIKFDRRYSYMSKLILWFNWVFFIYLLFYAIINVLAINLIFNLDVFSNLDATIMLLGYIFTYIKKKTIEFDNVGTIINKTL